MIRRLLVSSCVLFVGFNALSKERGETHEVGRWTYGCAEDHYDPYGVLLHPGNCWMMICEKEKGCLSVLKITKQGAGLSPYTVQEACEPAPHKAAVDGKRIDELSGQEQVKAITTGKTIIRQVEKRGWPYCEDGDDERSLDGANETWNLLQTLKAKGKYLK